MVIEDSLLAISPLDGRYYEKTKVLANYFSEFSLIKKRIFVELLYLKELKKVDFFKIYETFDLNEAKKVKEIEKITKHDLKAVEYYIKERIPKEIKEYVHYGLTSEDINNISYRLLIKEFLEDVFFEKISSLLKELKLLCIENKSLSMLARTHGQPASPTTLGKEFFVFYNRLKEQYSILQNIKLKAKLNGATGNFNAVYFSEPDIDWINFSKKFISKLGLEPNLITTQREPCDSLVELFQIIKRINNIVLDLDVNVWIYIMLDFFVLKTKEKEVGSSTMPHKVNPIEFENSEGNIKIANSLFTAFEDLQLSRLQRDLSDSTIFRNFGVAFSHSYLAYDSTIIGLKKLIPNKEKIDLDLEEHPEVLTEAVQTILRKKGYDNAYEKLKNLARGKKLTIKDIHKFIEETNLANEDKQRLKKLKPKDYIGLADKLIDL